MWSGGVLCQTLSQNLSSANMAPLYGWKEGAFKGRACRCRSVLTRRSRCSPNTTTSGTSCTFWMKPITGTGVRRRVRTRVGRLVTGSRSPGARSGGGDDRRMPGAVSGGVYRAGVVGGEGRAGAVCTTYTTTWTWDAEYKGAVPSVTTDTTTREVVVRAYRARAMQVETGPGTFEAGWDLTAQPERRCRSRCRAGTSGRRWM